MVSPLLANELSDSKIEEVVVLVGLRLVRDEFGVFGERILEHERALEQEIERVGLILAIQVHDFLTAVRHLLYFVDQLLVDIDEFGRGLGDFSEQQDLFEEQLTVIEEELFSELGSEIAVDECLYVVVLIKQVVEIHLIEVTANVVCGFFCSFMVALDGFWGVVELECDFSHFALTVVVILFEVLDVSFALFFLSTSHLVYDFDYAVDEEHEEEHYDEYGEVGESN